MVRACCFARSRESINLIELSDPQGGASSASYWRMLTLLIFVHAAWLGFVLGYSGTLSIPDRSEAVSPSDRVALAKADREPMRGILTIATGGNSEIYRAYFVGVRAAAQPFPRITLNAVLPEDMASWSAGNSAPTSAAEPSQSQTAAADAESPVGTENADLALPAAEMLPPRDRIQPLLAPRPPDLAARVAPVGSTTIVAPLSSIQNSNWPEDSGQQDSRSTELAKSEAQTPIGDPGIIIDRFFAVEEPAAAIAVPERRAMHTGEVASQELSSSSAPDLPSSAGDRRTKLLGSYRAKVRAHLAGLKPPGGFGSDTVVVGFTLSRTGKVVSAKILESRGIYHLEQGTLNAVHRAEPYPKPPLGLKGAKFEFTIPFRFE
jgi:TonB family protein